MFGKISGYFLLLVLVLDPSSAFQAKKCNIDLEWYENLLSMKQSEVSARLVLRAARVLLRLFEENPDLAKQYTSVSKFVQQLRRQGLEIITAANLAYFGAIVYLGGVIVSSYCFLFHWQKQLANGRLIEELDVIIEVEVKPILNYMEMLLKGGDGNGLRMACSMKKEVIEMFEERSLKIENIVHNIKGLRKKGTEDKEQSGVLKIASVVTVVAVVAGAVIAAPFVNPAGAIAAGVFGVAGSYLGYKRFSESQMTYKQELDFLEKAEDKAFQAEKAITMFQTDVELVCSLGLKKPESVFKWNLMLDAEEKMKTEAELTTDVAAAG